MSRRSWGSWMTGLGREVVERSWCRPESTFIGNEDGEHTLVKYEQTHALNLFSRDMRQL